MTVLLDRINRYIVALDDDLDNLAPDLVGSRAYSQESTSWFIWDGSSWTALTAELAAVDLDAVIAQSSGQDISDALSGAASPDASNVFATIADLTNVVADTDGLSFFGADPVAAVARASIPTQAVAVSVTDFNTLRDYLILIGLILDGD